MSAAEPVPSDEWAAVEHLWEDVAEAWFRPDPAGPTYRFRVPRDRLDTADTGRRLTVETLLEVASIPKDQVESWHLGDASGPEAAPELSHLLPPPPPDATHLTVYVRLKPPGPAGGGDESDPQDVPPEKWQALEALWRSVLGLEVSIDTLRLSMESLRAEMEAAFKKPLTVEDKLHALQADVAVWTKAKSRIHYALPKVREYIHRATWAAAVPERKALEEVHEHHIEPRVPLPGLDHVRERLEHLQKDRQVLFGQGNVVYQEGRGILAEIQRALSTLQRNAADRARKEREARRQKGKHL